MDKAADGPRPALLGTAGMRSSLTPTATLPKRLSYPSLGSHLSSKTNQTGSTRGVPTKQPAGKCCCHRGRHPPALAADQGDKVHKRQGVADAGAGLRDVGAVVVCQACSCGRHGCCDGACHGIPRDQCVATSWQTEHDVTHTCTAAGLPIKGCLQHSNIALEYQRAPWGYMALKADTSKQFNQPETRHDKSSETSGTATSRCNHQPQSVNQCWEGQCLCLQTRHLLFPPPTKLTTCQAEDDACGTRGVAHKAGRGAARNAAH